MNITANIHDDMPWLFSAAAVQAPNTLALARAGGNRGQTYMYIDDSAVPGAAAQGYCSTLGAGSRRGYGGHGHGHGGHGNNNNNTVYLPPSPPSSVSPPTTHIVRPITTPSLPPSPGTSFRAPGLAHPSSQSASPETSTSDSQQGRKRCAPVLPLITSVFPYAASSVAAASHMLEIVTPPSNVLRGFVTDTEGERWVFVHLPPTLSAPTPEPLAPHFSDVLRPHDPRRDHPVPPPAAPGLDIRDSLTALLDLADTLEATQLLLVLDKDERETALLAELMHSLMFVGGTPVRPGAPVGEWEWDARRWALVSIEL